MPSDVLDALAPKLPERAAPERPAGLEAAGPHFEAMLLQQMVRALRSTVPDSGLLPATTGQQIYDQPSIDFAAFLYPPLYYWVAALPAQVLGAGFRLLMALWGRVQDTGGSFIPTDDLMVRVARDSFKKSIRQV